MERKLVEVAWEITYRCNLRCPHCYNLENLGQAEEMSTAQAKEALGKLQRFGVEKLKIGGGEPLLREDFFELYRLASSFFSEVGFSTNGLLLERKREQLLEAGINKVQISLDDVTEKHDQFRDCPGLFAAIERAVTALQQDDVKINIATTLTTANYQHLNELLQFCRQHKIFRWKIMKYIPQRRQDQLLLPRQEYARAVNELLQFKQERDISPEIIVAREFDQIKVPSDYNDMQCFGGRSFFSLKPNGKVTPCSYLDDLVCGNILQDSVEQIWNSPVMLDITRDSYDGQCGYAEKCRGGCKAVSYRLGTPAACDPYCWVKGERGDFGPEREKLHLPLLL